MDLIEVRDSSVREGLPAREMRAFEGAYHIFGSVAVSDLCSESRGYGQKVRFRPNALALQTERGDRRRNCVCPCDMVSGPQQNILRTVTSVERYHGIWRRKGKVRLCHECVH